MRSRRLAALDIAAVCGFATIWTASAWQFADGGSPLRGLMILAALPLGLALADLASGFVHWLGDALPGDEVPLVGPLWIAPFREHHRDPLAITRSGALELWGTNCLLLLAPLGAARAWGPAPDDGVRGFGWALLLSFCFFGAATNQFHGWSHSNRVPSAIRWLQGRGWVLRPEHHALHHRGAHDTAYCVTTGWWNQLLDRNAFFASLERRLTVSSSARRAPDLRRS